MSQADRRAHKAGILLDVIRVPAAGAPLTAVAAVDHDLLARDVGCDVLVVSGGRRSPVSRAHDPLATGGSFAKLVSAALERVVSYMHRSTSSLVVLIATVLLAACGGESVAPAAKALEESGSAPVRKAAPFVPGRFTYSGTLTHERLNHTAVLLTDGRVMAFGGRGRATGNWNLFYYDHVDIYDPTTGEWTLSCCMTIGRLEPTATLLGNTKVLVVGGRSGSEAVAAAELYDPVADAFTAAGRMELPRELHAASPLPDGRVMVTGGYNDLLGRLASTEIYDPATEGWSAGAEMAEPRSSHTATVLTDGKVLVAGGGPPDGPFLDTAELYDPAANAWSPAGSMTKGRALHTATLLKDGRMLVVGGRGKKTSAELYDPSTDAWSSAGNTAEPHGEHQAVLLGDGRVLVMGGIGNRSSAELYDPTTNTWSLIGNMAESRYRFSATMLRDGRVLIAGGQTKQGYSATSELYTP